MGPPRYVLGQGDSGSGVGDGATGLQGPASQVPYRPTVLLPPKHGDLSWWALPLALQ